MGVDLSRVGEKLLLEGEKEILCLRLERLQQLRILVHQGKDDLDLESLHGFVTAIRCDGWVHCPFQRSPG